MSALDEAAAKVRVAHEAERIAFEACEPLPYGEARTRAYRAWRDAQRATFKAAADLFVLARAQRAARRA